MTERCGFKGLVMTLAMVLAAQATAAEDGQADLDKATDLKLKATTLQELAEVAELCEQAHPEGAESRR